MTDLKNYAGFLDGFLISPAPFRLMNMTMSPFSTEDAFVNRKLWLKNKATSVDTVDVNGHQGTITRSATEALAQALSHLCIAHDSEIWIETTTNNRYVSSCVTNTIERFCRWSRVRSDKTVAILVIHEFGFVYPRMHELLKMKLPIIEDAAYAMFSVGKEGMVGSWGDFVIYSLAKMFPMQAGGVLACKNEVLLHHDLDLNESQYFSRCFRRYIGQREEIICKRIRNHTILKGMFADMGFESRFHPEPGEVPGAFMFKAPERDLPELKMFMQSQGVECSVFYGEESFFVPCHQRMEECHLRYLADLVKWFFDEHHPTEAF
jgi:hypothetical protein